MRTASRIGPWLAAAMALALTGCERAPSVLDFDGLTGSRESTLGWFLVITALVMVLLVAVLVLVAVWRARGRYDPRPRAASESGLSWIMIGGILMPAVVLLFAFVFTTVTLGAVQRPSRTPAATIAIIGHQWWWEVHYLSPTPSQSVVTANELHLPVGEPVQIQLQSNDVIHSFWIPQLAGKTDVIPGQMNVMWLEATKAGVYHGQCGEYCGTQHAHMELTAVAESPPQFAQWLAAQRQTPTIADSSGLRVFQSVGCANCHTIQGTTAAGLVGPDLTHLASRRTLAAGTVPNTPGYLAAWITDAQGIKPGAWMPTMAVHPKQLQVLLPYLESLK